MEPAPAQQFISATVVLLGDSGVGKTALASALAGLSFAPTFATYGRQL